MNYFTVVGKFVCYYGEKAINETLLCDGNSDCPVIERFGIGFDESAYIYVLKMVSITHVKA